MKLKALISVVAVAMLAFFVVPVAAQEMTAAVRTWAGQSWRLTGPSLELFYTVIPAPAGGEASSSQLGGVSPPSESPSGSAPRLFGTAKEIAPLFGKQLETRQGQRQVEVVTLYRERRETRIPLASIASLEFFRTPVSKSPLPPHIAPLHFRYAATAVLTDGSRVEGDYVNLGATFFRGMTPGGRVDIPWEEIEAIRFIR
ncbi:MAG TPA: hypothetical protein VJO34_17000 [Methylomirabilota bacterium]|nr:hypothetical protein [Methylomirabilota bacterium]